MPNISYKDVPAFIVARKAFKTRTLRAVPWKGAYQVFSYATLIAQWVPDKGWALNSAKYTAITHKHQMMVRGALGVPT